jgi:hypothetical protein
MAFGAANGIADRRSAGGIAVSPILYIGHAVRLNKWTVCRRPSSNDGIIVGKVRVGDAVGVRHLEQYLASPKVVAP